MTRSRTKIIVVATAATTLLAAAVAEAAVTYTTSSKASINRAGSKAHPAQFNASFALQEADSTGARPPVPISFAWKWDGVKISGAGFPTCTAKQIAAAQSDAGCPKGSLVASGPTVVVLGPSSNPHSSIICNGKITRYYNGGPNTLTLFTVGPASQCAGVTYLPPFTARMTTTGHTTTSIATLPDFLAHPLPGVDATIVHLSATYTPLKAKHGRRWSYYMTSTSCKGSRKFTFTVKDATGVHPKTSSAGKCKA
jgi:hypothetical protein